MAEELTDEEVQRPLRELQEELSELTRLRDSAGYKKLMLIAKRQLESRQDFIVLTPLKKLSGVFEQEFQKGEMSGIKLFMEMTDAQIESLEAEIEAALPKEDEEKPK